MSFSRKARKALGANRYTVIFHLILVAWSGLFIKITDLITSEKFLRVNTAYL